MDERLQAVLERARKSPFYCERLKGISTWDQIAPTLKSDLRKGYPFGFLATDRKAVASYHESSGTEGNPTASYFTASDWKDVASRFLRNSVELNEKDTFFVKTPYSMVTTAHQAHLAGQMAGALVVPADNRSSNMPYSRVIQLLKDLEVTVTWSLPTEVILWRIAASQNGCDAHTDFPALRAFWVAGEPLSAGKRKMLSHIWGGKPVFEDYGSTETGSLAGECEKGKLHLWNDRIYFEVINEKGEVSREGRGSLLVTPYYREAMPLVRYLIEDDIEISSGCACGSEFPMIRIFGRRGSSVEVSNVSLSPLEIEHAVYEAGLSQELLLWRADYNEKKLEIGYYAHLDGNESDLEEQVSLKLKVPSRFRRLRLEEFVDPRLMTQKVSFSKPRFLFTRGEESLRGVQYA
jgi:phenylacetate-CoA ligase